MASICLIEGKWRALVRRKGHKPISKRFAKEAQAKAWARKMEAKIELGLAQNPLITITIAKLIDKYREMREKSHPILLIKLRGKEQCS